MRYLLLSLLIFSSVASAEVFKTINPDGSITYSDVQTEGSKSITPPGLTPTPAVKLPPKKKIEPENNGQPVAYQAFKITKPSSNKTIRNNNGEITVSIDIKPALQTKFKHSISIYLNGREAAKKLSSSTYTLKDVVRGRHSVSARLLDKNGNVLKRSNLVFVNMRRFSTLNKKQIDQRQKPAETDQDSDTNSDPDSNQGGSESSDPQNPWPTLPDYSNPQNVWPSIPNTPPPSNSP